MTRRLHPIPAPRSTTMRGQYFSFDAIMASVIFILGVSLLSSHWFALRAQIDASSDYLGQDAQRVSDLLLGVPNPIDYTSAAAPGNWYMNPATASRAGFSVNGSLPVVLNASQLSQAATQVTLLPSTDLVSPRAVAYNGMRALLSVGSHFRVEVNSTDPTYGSIAFGRAPYNANEIVQVRRSIVLYDATPPAGYQTHYFYGNLTLTLWTNQSRS